MRIAHVITRLLRAGSEENTIATCIAQANAGHDVWLIHGNEWNAEYRAECASRIAVIEARSLVHALDPSSDLAAIANLRTLFRQLQPDIVHTHQSKAGIIGRVAAWLAGVPTIVHGVHILPFHNVGPVQKAVYLLAERAIARFTDAFIDVSEGTRSACLEHSIGRPQRHFVVHSGFDIDRFRNAERPEAWRQLAGVSEATARPRIVLMLAALEERKRHVELLEAFRPVVERVPDVRLLIAGEGPMREPIETAIATLDLERHVRLLGFVYDPERLIALADVTLLTSLREGLPRVVLQSLAGGKPAVVTELPGIREIIDDGVNGIVTPADDLSLTADAVADLLLNPARCTAMQRNASATDVTSWSIDTMCRSISDIYVTLDTERRNPPTSVDEAA